MASRSPTSTPIQYEDFFPKHESKEETGSHVLVLNLPPEFKKEQIRITYVQSKQMIRVNGERPLVNNNWSRFNQSFPVPENCDVNKIEARYQNGVLTLTMPKTKPTTPEPAIATKEEQTKPRQQVTPPPPTPPKEPASTTARKRADDKTATTAAATTTQTVQKPPLEPKPQRGVEISSSLNGLKDRTTKKGEEETSQNVAPPKDDTGLSQQEESRKKRKEKLVGKSSDSKKRKESTMSEGLKEGKKDEKPIENLIAEKVKLVKGLAGSAKRNIQEFSMEVNEDRQAMVNIGVAILVIVALGTYIYYSRGSSRSAK